MSGAEPDRCPHCWMRLKPRQLGTLQATVCECGACGGFWIPWEILHELAERTRSSRALFWDTPPVSESFDGQQSDRRCPVCDDLMDRQSCAKVILDVCRTHGVWFDHSELEVFVSWVREETEQHRIPLPSAAGATSIAASVLAATPPLSGQREAASSSGFEGLEMLEPVAYLIEFLADIFSAVP